MNSWIKGAIHSTKISGNFGPKLNGSVRSNRKSFEKTGPPFGPLFPVGPVGILFEWIAPKVTIAKRQMKKEMTKLQPRSRTLLHLCWELETRALPQTNFRSKEVAVETAIERSGISFTANGRLKFPVYQKLVKFIWFQLMFYLLVTAMEQVLKTEK